MVLPAKLLVFLSLIALGASVGSNTSDLQNDAGYVDNDGVVHFQTKKKNPTKGGKSRVRVNDTDLNPAQNEKMVYLVEIPALSRPELPAKKPGICFMWNGKHVKTFDGQVYSFKSLCAHTLVQDSRDNTFNIIVRNGECRDHVKNHTCVTSVHVYLDDTLFELKNTNGVTIITNGKSLAIPSKAPGLQVERAGRFTIVELTDAGVTLKWNGDNLLQVKASESVWNRTAGLCGVLDGEIDDDLVTHTGAHPHNVLTYVADWTVDDLDDYCTEPAQNVKQCPGQSKQLGAAKKYCQKMFNDKRFDACKTRVKSHVLLDACITDYCDCAKNSTDCACLSVETYVRECLDAGVESVRDWRAGDFCPMKCDKDKIYKSCGSVVEPTCANPNVESNVLTNEMCEEGCFCRDGMFLDANGTCVTVDACPCSLRGKFFESGEVIVQDCNNCTCTGGQWKCSEKKCDGRCAAIGDPHYVTFDGRRYDFMGHCSYYLIKTDNYSVEAENVPCSGAISQSMNFPSTSLHQFPTCTKSVTVRLPRVTVTLKQRLDVDVNGLSVSDKLPYKAHGLIIKQASSMFLFVKLPNNLEIWWDGETRVYIDAPSTFIGTTQGLCGTFNANQNDDFITPDGDIEHSVTSFANKWKTRETCPDQPDDIKNHPCDINIEKKIQAENYCRKLKSQVFSPCSRLVDPEPFYENCLYDLCSCEERSSKCFCPIVSSYAKECADKGATIEWREEINECGIQCPAGQIYQQCANACQRSCLDISTMAGEYCEADCVEGCNCPDDQTLNDNGECVAIDTCPCRQDGVNFPAGFREIKDGEYDLETCTCTNAIWDCEIATEDEIETLPNAKTMQTKCNNQTEVFTLCESTEPITCKNMDQSVMGTSPAICTHGCECQKGFVLNTVTKMCVKPDECPCHHGGRSYNEGEVIKNDCNNCTCLSGKWTCTKRDCSAQCLNWGDSHYKTFDGRIYDFQGACNYILSKGASTHGSFDVTIQNTPCGSNGVTCSKSVTITAVNSTGAKDTITFDKDKPIDDLLHANLSQITVRQAGLFVIAEIPDLKISLFWDMGTRTILNVGPTWSGKLDGLCGNNNNDQMDDFRTPAGGIEVDARLFGDAWQLQAYCPRTEAVVDTCASHPHRKMWAVKKCHALWSGPFDRCHAEVDVRPYVERCVFDACACDDGGDCECLCTALAAYAQECNAHGVAIRWRSQKLCPVQCDEKCGKYTACMSTCPLPTCDNLLNLNRLSQLCAEENCVEGCSPKPCPPGEVYFNSSYLACVAPSLCKTVCLEVNGVTYYEGDLIEEDPCHSCYCSRNKRICRGEPCTNTSTPNPDVKQCQDGWTPWISTGTPRALAKGSKKQLEVEEIQNVLSQTHSCDLVTNISCRTVAKKEDYKTFLNVSCTVEAGLRCESLTCPDFEVQVYCQCFSMGPVPFTEPTTRPSLSPTTPEIEDKIGNRTCTDTDCPCRSKNGTIVKPGMVFRESKCEVCQCVDGQYICDDGLCRVTSTERASTTPTAPSTTPTTPSTTPTTPRSPSTTPSTTTTPSSTSTPTTPLLIINHTATPPEQCQEQDLTTLPLTGAVISGTPSYEPPNKGVWSPLTTNKRQYVQVEFPVLTPIYGIILQGGPLGHITSYKILHSEDGNIFSYIRNATGQPRTFRGPVDEHRAVRELFEPVETKIVRVNPETWQNMIVARLDVVGCNHGPVTSTMKPTTPCVPGDPLKTYELTYSSRKDSGKMWSPTVNTPFEWIQFDFIRPRNITGLSTVGSSDGWVTAYHVEYSHDGSNWNPLIDNGDMLFLGNYDATSDRVNCFKRPVQARYVRIRPKQWHRNIAIQVVPYGYGIEWDWDITTPVTALDLTLDQCHFCPGVQNVTEATSCHCVHNDDESEQFWNGERCVNRAECPCVVGHVTYQVGAFYETRDCKQCVCKLGGTSECKTKGCPPCEAGLQSALTTETCNCYCRSCEAGHRLCPTSNICLDVSLWCNGVEDCPDDEVACTTTTTSAPVKPEIKKVCPEISCPPGYTSKPKQKETAVELSEFADSPMLSKTDRYRSYQNIGRQRANPIKRDVSYVSSESHETSVNVKVVISGMSSGYRQRSMYKSGVKGGVKGGYRRKGVKSGYTYRKKLAKPREIEEIELEECEQFECVSVYLPPAKGKAPVECPPVLCPETYAVVFERGDMMKPEPCPRYSCKPPPVKDAVCNVTGRAFNTFDGSQFKLDVCDHVIARDMVMDNWKVRVERSCDKKQDCKRIIAIEQDESIVEINPDLTLTLNGYSYTIDQTKKIGFQNRLFTVSRMGNMILFISNIYGFWLMCDHNGNLKLGVSGKLIGKVDGTCGFFNRIADDDRRNPDGTQAKSIVEFANNWKVSSSLKCETTCPIPEQNNAFKLCNMVRDIDCETVNVDSFIYACLDTACDCLLKNKTMDECRCEVMESFVVQCQSTSPNRDMSTWRLRHDCPAACPAPFVHYDCFRYKCELSCDNVQDDNPCPIVDDICFPGCFCPPGFVRKGDTCVHPKQCRDCVCSTISNHYATFDRKNFTLSGNCSYVVAQPLNGETFQIFTTTRQCTRNTTATCPEAITIKYHDHHVKITNDKRRMSVIVDGENATTRSVHERWLILERMDKQIHVALPEIEMDVTVASDLSFTLAVPSQVYAGKTEGLCGACGNAWTDGFVRRDGSVTEKVDEFTLSWLAANVTELGVQENCASTPKDLCVPLPPDVDPCFRLLDENVFGQCHPIVDPMLHVTVCQEQLCQKNRDFDLCQTLESYAKLCTRAGLCPDWRAQTACKADCPDGLEYRACGVGCLETCDNYQALRTDPNNCTLDRTEGCFCPDGKVFHDAKCVETKLCTPCDDEHYEGDVWRPDKCTECACVNDAGRMNVQCSKQTCASSHVCDKGYMSVLVNGTDRLCCPEYQCAPEPKPNCSDPIRPRCASDQIMKQDASNDCPVYICVCKPADQCEKLTVNDTNLPAGIKTVIDTTAGCCPILKQVCDKSLCAEPIKCPKFYKRITHVTSCCPEFICEAPDDKCLYNLEYESTLMGGEMRREQTEIVAHSIGETWMDGPCRECECQIDHALNNLRAQCRIAQCPDIDVHVDNDEFVLDYQPIPGQCCPDIKRIMCKHDGIVYNVNSTWTTPGDRCVTYKCVTNGNDDLQKISTVQHCNKTCELGWTYKEPSKFGECCGQCEQYACTFNGELRQRNEEWHSHDFCTIYICKLVNNSMHVEATRTTCATDDEFSNQFVYAYEQIPGKCCARKRPIACKDNGHVYNPNQIWPSPDPCVNYTCLQLNDDLFRQKIVETCNVHCEIGFEYQQPITDECCGKCVPVACVYNDTKFAINSTWRSWDNCTIFSCDQFGPSKVMISASTDKCPELLDCPPERVYLDGCCERCNISSGALTMNMCEPIVKLDTIGIIEEIQAKHGHCRNNDAIDSFNECAGLCQSRSYFDKKTLSTKKDCKCCQAAHFRNVTVSLTCDDGFTYDKRVPVASECSCLPCDDVHDVKGWSKITDSRNSTVKGAAKGGKASNIMKIPVKSGRKV